MRRIPLWVVYSITVAEILVLVAFVAYSILELRIIAIEAQIPPIVRIQREKPSIQGQASWYQYTLPSGWSSKNHYVAAMRDIPRKMMVRVTNLENSKSVDVLITDTGPDKKVFPDRVIDLSPKAFEAIRGANDGIIKKVKIYALGL